MKSIMTILLLMSLYLIHSISKEKCPKYRCSETINNSGICFESLQEFVDEKITSIFQFNTCGSNKSCKDAYSKIVLLSSPIYEKSQTLNCENNNSNSIEKDLPAGEGCDNNTKRCWISCENQICSGKKENETCNFDLDCNIGLTCIKGKCLKQRLIGETCETDFNCINECGCFNGQCIKYYSLSVGAETDSSSLCQSGYMSTLNEKFICEKLDLIKSDCENTDTCEYKYSSNGSLVVTNCICRKYIDKQETYCPINNGEILSVNTSSHTLKRWGTIKKVSDVTDDCIGKSIYSDEWNLIKNSHHFFIRNNNMAVMLLILLIMNF